MSHSGGDLSPVAEATKIPLSKGQAKISSMNRLNCVSDLMSDLIENTGYAALSIYILQLQLPYILALFKHD